MVLLITASKAQEIISNNLKERRLDLGFTQKGLAERSGVNLPTLRKFEQKGLISLESFLKLSMALEMLEDIVKATESEKIEFSSINEILKEQKKTKRKRGWRQ